MKEWRLSDLIQSIQESTDLLDLVHTHNQEELAEHRIWQISVVLAVITLGTFVSVTKDAFDFLTEQGTSKLSSWLILFGPVVVFALLFLAWIASTPHFKKRNR